MLDHLVNTMKSPWFFGTLNRPAAEAKLQPYKAEEGTFLVRLNTGSGEAIEVSPYTISRIEGEAFVHNRACPSKKGGFFIKAKNTQIRADGTLQDLVTTILRSEESPCTKVCPGHPFGSIFVAGAQKIVGNYQMNDDEED